MPSAGLEPMIPATKRSQTYALDRVVTGIGNYLPTSNYSPTNPPRSSITTKKYYCLSPPFQISNLESYLFLLDIIQLIKLTRLIT
jgi:hypothetical protein